MAVPGYVFWPDDRNSGTQPVGFGLFRAIDGGYELWLAGLDLGARGEGHGRPLLAALFATPQGQKTWILRVQRGSRYVAALQHLLHDFGFNWVGDTCACAGSCAPTHRPTRIARARCRRRAQRAKLAALQHQIRATRQATAGASFMPARATVR